MKRAPYPRRELPISRLSHEIVKEGYRDAEIACHTLRENSSTLLNNILCCELRRGGYELKKGA